MSVSTKPSISLGGRIVEVGRDANGANEIVLDVSGGQRVCVQGVSDTFAKFMAANLFENAMLTMQVGIP